MPTRPLSRLTVSLYAAAFVCLLAGARPATTARRPIPDVRGTWTGTYTADAGFSGTVDVVISTQRGSHFTGTLADDGGTPLPLTGTITAARRYKSTARTPGYVSKKTGTLSTDGNTISGRYTDRPGGRGDFIINRVP